MFSFLNRAPRHSTTNSIFTGLDNWLGSGPANDIAKVLLNLRLEKIGRGNAGKSAVEWAFAKVIVSNFFASGLQLDVENPQQVAELIEKDIAIRTRLESDPLLPTTEATPIKYYLYEGERPRLCLASHECIGQILLNTKPNSPPEWKTKYQEYMDRLPRAHVLWLMFPVPPSRASASDHDRFQTDLKVTVGYLREALKLRREEVPVATAFVLTRSDSRYDDATAARNELTDEALFNMLRPLVNLVRMTDKVAEAAVFVTSAYGFGNALRKPEFNKGPSGEICRHQDGQWMLKPDAHVAPFNLLALASWTLYHGLNEQKVEGGTPDARTLIRIRNLLKYDLDDCDGWIVPVKTRALATE
jgi:hypothetical protein